MLIKEIKFLWAKHCYHNLYILQNQVLQFKLESKEILKCEQHILKERKP
jgi:hypothetical protein